MSNLYNLVKDLIRKEAYFDISVILEDLFQIKHVPNSTRYEFNENKKITLYKKFYHDVIKEEVKGRTSYKHIFPDNVVLCVILFLDGSLLYSYFKDDKHHREDGPAILSWYPDGTLKHESWWQNDMRYKIDGPAYRNYYPNGSIKDETWCQDGRTHRIDGPARTGWYPDGKIMNEFYFVHGLCHREDGPAQTHYHPNGSIESQYYYWEYKIHRIDGPAIIEYDLDGIVVSSSYHENDKFIRHG